MDHKDCHTNAALWTPHGLVSARIQTYSQHVNTLQHGNMATGPRGRPIRIERRLEEASDTDDELFFDIAKRNTKSSAGADQGASVEKVTADQDTLHSNDISQGHETQPQHGQEDTGPTSPGHYGGEGPHPAAWTPLSSPHRQSCSSLVDGLLFDIYDRWHYRQRDSFDSDTFTECSSTSDAFFGRSDSLHLPEFEQRHSNRFRRAFLEAKGKGVFITCPTNKVVF